MSRSFLLAVLLAVLLVAASAQTSSYSSSSSSSTGSASGTSSVTSSMSTASASSSTAATPSANLTFCETYSGTTTNATTQQSLIANIVTRAAVGGIYTFNNTAYDIPGLFNSSGPLYSIFSGQTQYRVGAPDYTTNTTALATLASHLVSYFGALFGCGATGYPAVNNPNMYAVHANMSINSTMENYFVTQLALTLLSFGVPSSVVTGTAAPVLGWFNRCGPPISYISSTALVQICGTSDCDIATDATYATCVADYGYPALSSSSTGTSSGGASAQSTLSVLAVIGAAVVASLVL